MYASLYSGPAQCENCKFYRPLQADDDVEEMEFDGNGSGAEDYGRCVRFPPRFFYEGLLNAEFPVVHITTWCGEFKRNDGT